jgi:hypothetical protein
MIAAGPLELPLLAAGGFAAAVAAGFRFRHGKRVLEQVDGGESYAADVEAQTVAGLDQSVISLEDLVDSMERGPARDAARDALRSAKAAHDSRVRLVRRRTQLRHVRAAAQSPIARRRLDDALLTCEDELRDLDFVADELCASVADLASMAAEMGVHADVSRLKEAAEHMNAIADSLRQVSAPENPSPS